DRAVRAAFAIRERVRELSGRSEALQLELRIGIDTGETVAGGAEGDQFLVTGEPVIAAARIRGAAEPGEIAVGALTHRLTTGGVSFGEGRTFEAKGIGPLDLWPAIALRSDVPSAQRGLGGLRAPLIGRDHELRLLREALDRVGAERAPSLVTVFGAAGAGKSRLVAEFTVALPEERVRIGRCLPYGEGITFYPLQQILRADAGVDLSAPRADALAALRGAVERSLVAERTEAEAVARRLEVVLGLAEGPDALPEVTARDLMEELRWGVRRYFERRVSEPLVLVFEDVHWAEPALIDLIEHLAEWAKVPLLVVCLARPEFREVRPTFGASAANALAITLSPLGPEDTRRLIHELLAIEALPEDVRAEVVARAEGNPLFVEEFLRTLIETGRIVQRDGRWAVAREIGAIEIPPTLQGLITARLDRVAPEVKRLLQSASIVGRLFSTSALAAIGGETPGADLLREAARRDLITEVDERAPGEGRVHRFKHALFRDVAYSTIPKVDRVGMHDRYGRWLETTFGDRAEEVREIVAHHAEQAFLCAKELALQDTGTLGQRALGLLVLVADRARIRGDAHAAWRLYERASGVADATGANVQVRAHALGFAVLGGRDFVGERWAMNEELERAIALAREAGPSEVLMHLLNARAVSAFQREDIETAKRTTAEIPDIARATGDADVLTWALAECGERAYWWGDRAAQERLLLEAVEAGRRGARPTTLAKALGQLVACLTRYRGDYARAAVYEREIDTLDPAALRMRRARGARSAYHRGDFDAVID
ncbi:MAG TPA: AAA family ATPase, partial [Gemmatimonadaceae bacterium]